MKTEIDYPFEGGGIRMEEILSKGERDVVRGTTTGGSGNELYYTVTPDLIYFADSSDGRDKKYWMGAHVDIDGNFMFDVVTRRDAEPHPDFFARRFVGVALQQLETRLSQAGRSIETCRGRWEPTSINYGQFFENYRATKSRRQAALSTWTGQVFSGYGFDQIHNGDVHIGRYQKGLYRGYAYIVTAEFKRD